jgi:ATP-dependent Clp protease ATP-binding subunit ClpB
MDDGRLTDAKGRTVDFKNTVLIMTSNLGAAMLAGETLKTEHDFDMARESVMRVLREHFRPEFLNRVDDIVIFRRWATRRLSKILDLRLNEVRKLLEDRQISLELTEPARQLILASGSDAAYGARPLKRALQRMVQDPLAIKILDGEVLHGSHVRIDVDRKSNQLQFEPMGREAMAFFCLCVCNSCVLTQRKNSLPQFHQRRALAAFVLRSLCDSGNVRMRFSGIRGRRGAKCRHRGRE